MTTPLYPPSGSINQITQGVFPFHVNAEYFREWIQETPFYNFMGMEPTRPIVKHTMKAGEGWQYRVSQLSALDWTNPIMDFDQVSGSGQYQKVDYDTVDCHKFNFPVTVKGRELIELGTPVRIDDAIRSQLVEASSLNFNKCLLDTAMFNWKNPTDTTTGGYIVASTLPSYDRVAFGGKNPGSTGTQNAADRTAYYAFAGISTACNGFGAVGYAGAGLSVNHLMKLKALAIRGGYNGGATLDNGRIENAIRPAYMKTLMGFPMNKYIYLATTESIQSLSSDPIFAAAATARGTVVEASQPQMINGADYFGEFRGIHIYEVKDLALYNFTSQDAAKLVAWELFIGAGAWSVGWYKEPVVKFRENVIDEIQEFKSTETRGQKAIRFTTKQPQVVIANKYNGQVEQGIIHSFVRIG